MIRENIAFPEQYLGEEDLPGEEWLPVVYQDEVSDKYFVSNYGGVKGPRGMRLKWVVRSKKSSIHYPSVTILQPGRDVRQKADVHVLVANTFLTLTEDTLPEPLRGFNLNEEAIRFVRSLLSVDHIDDNPRNPNVDNLRYTSARQNNYMNKIQEFADK